MSIPSNYFEILNIKLFTNSNTCQFFPISTTKMFTTFISNLIFFSFRIYIPIDNIDRFSHLARLNDKHPESPILLLLK